MLSKFLVLFNGRRAGVGSPTQTFFPPRIPRRAGGVGQMERSICDIQVVAFSLSPGVTAVLLFSFPGGDTATSSCPNMRTRYLFHLLPSIFIISTQPLAISMRTRYEQELCGLRRFCCFRARPK